MCLVIDKKCESGTLQCGKSASRIGLNLFPICILQLITTRLMSRHRVLVCVTFSINTFSKDMQN